MEEENAEKAFEEYEATGATSRRCLRCGGRLLFFDAGSAYQIRCERDGCFTLTSRGI
jgi:hypothetical protein